MRLTEFWERMGEAFGPAYAQAVAKDQVLPSLSGRTVLEALEAGVGPKTVWRAVCVDMELPASVR